LARAAGRPEYRVGHLAGFRGRYDEGGLFPEEPVDLRDDQLAADAGEGATTPVG
jgi:hypothetical protein